MNLLFLLAFQIAHAGSIANVVSDQSAYSVGSKAILIATVDHPAESPNEVALRLRMNQSTLDFVSLGGGILLGFPNRFTTPGTNDASIDVLLQDKYQARTLQQAISNVRSDTAELEKLLSSEKDPEARELLEKQIAQNNQDLSALSTRLEDSRTLVEINHIPLQVNPAIQAKNIFSLSADHSNLIYQVGQKAQFFAHLDSLFSGPEGIKEHILRANIDGTSISTKVIDIDDYSFLSKLFTNADIGSHQFSATLHVRSKSTADLLRKALNLSFKKKAELQKEHDNSESYEKAYYNYKIEDMNAAIAAIQAQLEDILLQVGSNSLNFTVIN